MLTAKLFIWLINPIRGTQYGCTLEKNQENGCCGSISFGQTAIFKVKNEPILIKCYIISILVITINANDMKRQQFCLVWTNMISVSANNCLLWAAKCKLIVFVLSVKGVLLYWGEWGCDPGTDDEWSIHFLINSVACCSSFIRRDVWATVPLVSAQLQ